MKRVFVDTFYWVALLDEADQWHDMAAQFTLMQRQVQLVTSEHVLIEFANFFSSYSPHHRSRAVTVVASILGNSPVQVLSHTHEALMSGISLYLARPDKQYSLTDCISMQMMREHSISEVLTHDQHFNQEGFVALLR